MANEAVLRQYIALPEPFTVADGTGIEKGTILKLTDPRTAIATSAADDPVAGIAAREKVASDGRTELAVYTQGVFDMSASGAITAGNMVAVTSGGGGFNFVKEVNDASGANILGRALETAADNEVIQVKLQISGKHEPS